MYVYEQDHNLWGVFGAESRGTTFGIKIEMLVWFRIQTKSIFTIYSLQFLLVTSCNFLQFTSICTRL